MFTQKQRTLFSEYGYLVVPAFETLDTCQIMLEELQHALDEDHLNYPNAFDLGMVHNCFLRGKTMRDHLSSQKLRDATDNLFCKNAIIYAYQSSSLRPGHGNYGSRIHVDSPRYIPNYKTNLGYILALDPFNEVSGGTWISPGSHKSERIPDQVEFEKNAIQIMCNRGDAIFFDARLVHRAGENHSAHWRHAITINFCRPFMRSRFDFPKMIGQVPWVGDLGGSARTYLGFDVRMPASLDEFYLPESERLYLSNQE